MLSSSFFPDPFPEPSPLPILIGSNANDLVIAVRFSNFKVQSQSPRPRSQRHESVSVACRRVAGAAGIARRGAIHQVQEGRASPALCQQGARYFFVTGSLLENATPTHALDRGRNSGAEQSLIDALF